MNGSEDQATACISLDNVANLVEGFSLESTPALGKLDMPFIKDGLKIAINAKWRARGLDELKVEPRLILPDNTLSSGALRNMKTHTGIPIGEESFQLQCCIHDTSSSLNSSGRVKTTNGCEDCGMCLENDDTSERCTYCIYFHKVQQHYNIDKFKERTTDTDAQIYNVIFL